MKNKKNASTEKMDFYWLLLKQREQIQQDLLCVLDGQPQAMTDAACQAVVKGFDPLREDKLLQLGTSRKKISLSPAITKDVYGS
jgi:hypothetical protein